MLVLLWGNTLCRAFIRKVTLTYFEEKVDKFVKSAHIDPDVYNGKTKLVAGDCNFISRQEILESIDPLTARPHSLDFFC